MIPPYSVTGKAVIMKHVSISLIALCSALLMTAPASACSCGGELTAASILARSSAVFTARVYSVRPVSARRSLTRFIITESFKGPPAASYMEVTHPHGSTASCGVRFQKGRSYTLMAHREPGTRAFTTSHCSSWMFRAGSDLGLRLINGMRAQRRR